VLLRDGRVGGPSVVFMLGRLPEAWIAPPATRELRELVRYRAKLVALRSGLKAQVHAVMAKEGVLPAVTDMFCQAGNHQLDTLELADAYATRVHSSDAESCNTIADGSGDDARRIALAAKRRALIALHERNAIGDDVYRQLLDQVDVIAEREKHTAMKVIRIVPNLSSEAFAASRDFYGAMFDLVVSVEQDDWYLQLMPESDTRLNIGFVKPDHELFAGRTGSAGTYGLVLTIHVDDVDEAYERATRLGADIAAEIRNEEYGQRHFLLVDPNGLLLNVMSAI
jgi:predicted enzyme related to lactoylglutathione lyase